MSPAGAKRPFIRKRDIVVDNDPAKEYAGTDEQLKKGIEVILEELKTKEKKLPKVPPYPKK